MNQQQERDFDTNLGTHLCHTLWVSEAEREVQGKSFVNPADLERICNFLAENTYIKSLQKQRLIKEVGDEARNMIISDPKCYCKTHPEHNCGFTSNEAIEDVLKVLRRLQSV